ncbi:MAG: acyltransferase [Ruminococcus flavefaciens]|nr:acyltransferase [Ruminococcus flavefaciens]
MKIFYFLYKIMRKIYVEGSNYHNRHIEGVKIGNNCNVSLARFFVPDAKDGGQIQIGNFSHIYGELSTMGYGGKINIGEYCFVGPGTRIWAGNNIIIGDRVEISHNCNIFDNDTHPKDARDRHEQFLQTISTGKTRGISLNDAAVIIGDDVWIGANVTILKGVTIGARSIIGAGSIVTKPIPSDSFVSGDAAKTKNARE